MGSTSRVSFIFFESMETHEREFIASIQDTWLHIPEGFTLLMGKPGSVAAFILFLSSLSPQHPQNQSSAIWKGSSLPKAARLVLGRREIGSAT